MDFYFSIAKADVHEQLAIVHTELKVDVIPVLDEMAGQILN